MSNSTAAVNNTLQCHTEGTPVAVHLIQTCVYLAIFVVALLGNIMILTVVFTHKRMRSHYLIVNIAAGDLLMVVFAMIPTAVSMLRNTHRWIGGLVGVILCKMLAFTINASISCSIFSMTALAFERFLAVVFPMKRYVNMSSKLIVIVWLASVLSSSPLLYATKVVVFQGVPYCAEDWSPAFDPVEAPAVFTVISFVLQYALPLLVMCPLYSVIILKVWYRKIPGNTTPANARLAKRSKKNVVKMLVSTVVAFAGCWLLTHINFFMIYFTRVSPHPCARFPWQLQLCGFLLGHSNTAINCCIYVTFSRDYRRGFKELLRPFLRHRTYSVTLDQSQKSVAAPRPSRSCYPRLEGMGPDAERPSGLAVDTAL